MQSKFSFKNSDGRRHFRSHRFHIYLSTDWGDGEKVMCGEIGAKLSGKVTLTEEWCNNNYTDSSIEDEKPEGCEVTTD